MGEPQVGAPPSNSSAAHLLIQVRTPIKSFFYSHFEDGKFSPYRCKIFLFCIMLVIDFGVVQQEIHSITLLVLCDQDHRHVEHILECCKCYTFRVYVLH
jgi:hypothetical protein